MHTPSAPQSILAACRRRLARGARTSLHAAMLLAALFSTGIVPAAIAPASNEAESSQQEGPSSQYAALHCDARTRLRRPSPHRCDASVLTSLLPTAANRRAHTSACALTVPQLSLGLTIPLRC